MASHSLLTMLVLLLSVAAPSLSMEFGKRFEGDGTYYGTTEGGHCSIREPRPKMYSQWQPIALNSAQYANSLPCGACISFTGTGRGSGANPIVGTRIGYIMDECPSCSDGDIDLSKSGDGRWDVSWKFIPCPEESQTVDFLLEGSNDYYKKVQPRGLKSPVESMSINGVQGDRKVDNFFEFHAQFPGSATAVMKTVLGETVSANIPYWVSDGVIVGGGKKGSGGGGSGGKSSRSGARKPSPKKKKTPKRNSRRRRSRGRCVPKYRTCSGKKAYRKFGTTKCCGGYRCGWPKRKRGHGGRRCLPPKSKKKKRRKGKGGKKGRCVPNWKPCTGRNNVWGTSNCCGNYKCVSPGEKSFVGKRCEPK